MINTKSLRILLIAGLALFPVIGGAQQPSVRQPVLSFVPDTAGGLRPLLGITGSASVGTALNLGFEIGKAAIPPEHDYILAIVQGGGWPVLLEIRGDAITPRSLSPSIGDCLELEGSSLPWERKPSRCARSRTSIERLPKIDRIALSSSGDAAAFLSESEGRIYTFGNLNQSPVFRNSYDVAALGSVTAFAITDDGGTVGVGVSRDAGGSLFLLQGAAQPKLAASLIHPAAIRFLRKSADALVADDADNKIYALSNGSFFQIAGAAEGISTPSDVAISNDNQSVFVASAQSRSVTTIGLNGAAPATISCECELTGLHPTNSDSVFRLTDFSGGSVLLFDGNPAAPRMFFVPAGSQ